MSLMCACTHAGTHSFFKLMGRISNLMGHKKLKLDNVFQDAIGFDFLLKTKWYFFFKKEHHNSRLNFFFCVCAETPQ
jgi:hypothetical protein